jgi:DNA polymerase III subunit delta'
VSVWDAVLGQAHVVADFQRAVDDAELTLRGERGLAMSHAWLVTGPPGSGRSTAALAFAAALMCPEHGCGQCAECRAVKSGAHVDVERVVPYGQQFYVADVLQLLRRCSMPPTRGPWHVIVVEDADRLTPETGNSLLKAVEEPPPGTVWVLCAPSVEDVLPTLRSRCRHIALNQPSILAVALELQQRHGVDPAMAAFAARASQGHVGRARALATDETARLRRAEVLRIPTQIGDLPSCFAMASDLVATAKEDAEEITAPLDAAELQAMREAYGEGAEGRGIGTVERRGSVVFKDLKRQQEARARRVLRDQLDRALVDLIAFYRDVIVVQTGATVGLINDEMSGQISSIARASIPEDNLRRIDALKLAKVQIEGNVSPQLAFESLMVALRDPSLAAI